MLIKPASGLCNLRCTYCFYEDVMAQRHMHHHGLMSKETMHRLIEHVLSYFRQDVEIHFAFQGGEPTLAGLDYFVAFVDEVQKQQKAYHHIRYSIQTNGTMLDDHWFTFLKKHQFLVGLSLDGFMENHDQNRYDAYRKGTFLKVLGCAKKLKEYQIEFNLLTVLTNQLARSPKALWDFYLEHDFRYIQLIPCLPPFEGSSKMALTPHAFYSFYHQFFQYWYQAWQKKHYVSITLFDQLIPMFVGIPPQQCGYLGHCAMQYVVEANGDVYPCDFYVLDQNKVGNIAQQDLRTIIKASLFHPFFQEKKEGCTLCASCPFEQICHGQCKRLSVCYYDQTYCGYQQFIQENIEKLLTVARQL